MQYSNLPRAVVNVGLAVASSSCIMLATGIDGLVVFSLFTVLVYSCTACAKARES